MASENQPRLRLEPADRLRIEGEPGFQVVYGYNVRGLPEGHGAYIQNLDYPRVLGSIQRTRDGKPEGGPTGNYQSAEIALSVLENEYANFSKEQDRPC